MIKSYQLSSLICHVSVLLFIYFQILIVLVYYISKFVNILKKEIKKKKKKSNIENR